MVLGMTVVFTFLVILVFVVNIQAKLIAKYFPEKAPVVPDTTANIDEKHHIAAIVGAIAEFRKNK
jgi:oxaloacetate decarboxylase gamma subunit